MKYIKIILAVAILFSIRACKDKTSPASSDIVFPTSGVSYSKHVGPLFQQTCALSGCHTSGGQKPNLEYSVSYSNLLDYIIIGEPDKSMLVLRIDGTLPPQMPPSDVATLTKNQIDGVKTWIKEGAKPN
jgi:hypothetical protein